MTAFGPQDRPARTADNFDAVDVLNQHVLRFPISARGERGVHRAAIDQHEHRSGEAAVEPANANRVFARGDARHLNPRRQPQCFRNVGGAVETLDVFLRDHVNCSGRFPHCFRLSGDRGDLDIPELFKAQGFQGILIVAIHGRLREQGCIYGRDKGSESQKPH